MGILPLLPRLPREGGSLPCELHETKLTDANVQHFWDLTSLCVYN